MRRRSFGDLEVFAITIALSASCAQVLGLPDFEDAPQHGEAGTGPDDGGSSGTGGSGGNVSGGTSGSGVGGNLGGTAAGGVGSGGKGGTAGKGGTVAGGAGSGGKGGNAGTTSGSGGAGGDPGDHCRWNCDGAECVLEAEDADMDGYGSSECTSAPGPDCDDTDNAINSIRFTREVAPIANRHSMTVTWNPMRSEFGLLGNSGMDGIYFTSIKDGIVASASDSVVSPNGIPSFFVLGLTWVQAVPAYGTFYSTMDSGGPSVIFHYMSEAGEGLARAGLGPVGFPGVESADCAVRANGDVLVTVAAPSELHVGDILDRPPPEYVAYDKLTEVAVLPRLATNGDDAAVAWTMRNSTRVKWARISAPLSDMSFSNPIDLSENGLHPDVVTVGGNYAIGWVEASRLMFQISRSDGTMVCEPVPIAFGDATLDQEDGIALVATANGTLVFGADHAGAVALFRMNDSCEVVGDAVVHEQASSPSLPNLAVGNGTVALVWDEFVGGSASAQFRLASELGCP